MSEKAKKMKTYAVQVSITNALVSFDVKASSLEQAVEVGKSDLNDLELFADGLEHIDSTVEVTGAYLNEG